MHKMRKINLNLCWSKFDLGSENKLISFFTTSTDLCNRSKPAKRLLSIEAKLQPLLVLLELLARQSQLMPLLARDQPKAQGMR